MNDILRIWAVTSLLLLISSGLHAQGLGRKTIPCPDFNNYSAAGFRLIGLIGVGNDTRSLSPANGNGQSSSLFSSYIDERDATEVLDLGLSAELRVERDILGGFFVGLGGVYDLHLATATLPGIVQDSFRFEPVFTNDGQVLIRTDTLVDSFRENLTSRNRIHNLTPTGSVGYRFYMGSVSLSIAGEVGYSFLVSARGAIVSPAEITGFDADPIAYSQSQLLVDRPGLRFGGHIDLGVPVSSNLDLVIEAYYRRGGDMAGAADPLQYQLDRTGLSVGISMAL